MLHSGHREAYPTVFALILHFPVSLDLYLSEVIAFLSTAFVTFRTVAAQFIPVDGQVTVAAADPALGFCDEYEILVQTICR